MNLQKNIAETMNQLTKEISASIQEKPEIQRRLNILKNSINTVVNLSPDDIIFESNVRHKVDENSDEFEKLCESIKKYGLLKNIVAELIIADDDNSYKLVCVAGHRRLSALRKLGLKNKIPCLIKQYDKADRVGAALSENLNREGLSCVDIANGYLHLNKNNWSIDQIAKHFEKDKKTVARFLKLAELPDDIKESLQKNQEVFSNRIIFNEILTKHKLPGDVRKAIERKLNRQSPNKNKTKLKLKEKLENFFKQEKIRVNEKELILKAFSFVGLLK